VSVTWRNVLRSVGDFARTRADTSRAASVATDDDFTRGVNAGRRYAFDLIADECHSLSMTVSTAAEVLHDLQQLERRADRRAPPLVAFMALPRGQA